MTRVRHASLATFACLLCALALGCTNASNRHLHLLDSMDSGLGGRGGKRDASADGGLSTRRDGALPFDAAGATMDASVLGLDGSLELPPGTYILPDGAIYLPDGQIIDLDAAIMRFTPEIDVASCSISQNEAFSAKVDIYDEGGFSLVPGHTGFGLAFRGLGAANCPKEIDLMHIPATSGFPMPLIAPLECEYMTDVALLGLRDGWRLAWVDNLVGMAELHTIALDLDMKVRAGEMRRQLTANTLQLEVKPVLRQIAGRPMAAWITDDMNASPDAFRVTTQLLDGDAKPIDVVPASLGQAPTSLAFAQMGTDAAAIGWVGPATNPGVWLQNLDANGAAVDAPSRLTEKVAASSSIDLAGRINGGAAVYSIEIDGQPQVRFRRLDEHGSPIAEERQIVGPPMRAQGASLASLGGGYAVAFRVLSGGPLDAPEVRLTFVTKEGNVLRDPSGQLLSYLIGPATTADGRTYVSVSVEGEIMVAWIDADPAPSGKNLLKVVRRRLDCQ